MSSRSTLVTGSLLLASLLALAPAARPLGAQQSSVVTPRDGRDTSGVKATTPRSASSVTSDSALVELGRAMTALAVSVQTIVTDAANKPEVRRAAVQVAGKAVSVAQKTLQENTVEIERLLAEASRRLADVEASQRAKPAARSAPSAPSAPPAPERQP